MSEPDQARVKIFLERAKALFPTSQYTFKPSDKNRELDIEFNLRDQEKVEILKSLTVEDCIEIRQNDNVRYPDADIFIFMKQVNLESYGEEITATLYIKDYIITVPPNMEMVIVISFHREGMHDM
ncbi:MAG: hypothetical protein MSB10_08215 [Clostridiales bacterium]|uniref:hypothetical protein n=1 Tax=Flavonifractor porci TaxID=3133422 RepID=UPI00309D8C48|nr:hypothetical protein [Clostridiales bacterium]